MTGCDNTTTGCDGGAIACCEGCEGCDCDVSESGTNILAGPDLGGGGGGGRATLRAGNGTGERCRLCAGVGALK